MSYDLPVKRCFDLEDHPEHSWELRGDIYVCPGMPVNHQPTPESGAVPRGREGGVNAR